MTLDQAVKHIKASLDQEPTNMDAHRLTDILSPEKEIFLYGGGEMGHIVYAELQRLHIPVAGYMDRSDREGLLPVPVYTSEQMRQKETKNVTVLISYISNCYEDTIEFLTAAGMDDIILPVNFLAQKMIFAEELRKEDRAIRQSEDQILETLTLLEDGESRNVFCGMVRAYITKDFEKNIICCKHSSLSPRAIQGWNAHYDGLIDCGAFIGDTLEEFLRCHNSLGWYIGFEPNMKTFKACSEFVKSQKEKLGTAMLYPCGVGDSTGFSGFESAEAASGSKITEAGSEIVPVVRIDDVILKFVPKLRLLLKMDVEGYESAALDGARIFIKENKPDIMVCVYHKVADLWQLPLKLHETFPDYRFYLRCFTMTGVETVLYAFHKEG